MEAVVIVAKGRQARGRIEKCLLLGRQGVLPLRDDRLRLLARAARTVPRAEPKF